MREFRGMRLCGKYIALDLTKRDRPTRQCTIGVKDGIVGVLPALIDETRFSLPRVFDKAVPSASPNVSIHCKAALIFCQIAAIVLMSRPAEIHAS